MTGLSSTFSKFLDRVQCDSEKKFRFAASVPRSSINQQFFLIGNQLQVTLLSFSPEISKQCLRLKSWKAKAEKSSKTRLKWINLSTSCGKKLFAGKLTEEKEIAICRADKDRKIDILTYEDHNAIMI